MKLAGFLLLVAGWGIAVAAVAIFRHTGVSAIFVASGVAVEVLGLSLAVRGHLLSREEQE